MYFQSLDDRRECVAYYDAFGDVVKEFNPLFKHTWGYAQHLCDKGVIFASLYQPKKTLDEQCPEHLLERLREAKNKLLGIKQSLIEAKVDTSSVCVYDLIPHNALAEFCLVKNLITKNVIENVEKPQAYDLYVKMAHLASDIRYRKLVIDKTALKDDWTDVRARSLYQKQLSPYIIYDFFKSKTGRATTKGGFPILNLDKRHRKIIRPTNDFFVELDYNAADIRVLWGMLGKTQPKEDIHDLNGRLFKMKMTREDAKKAFFAWLYNPDAKDEHNFSTLYNKDVFQMKYWKGGSLINPFGVEMECDEFHFTSYLIQSTMAYMFYEQAHKLYSYLQGKQTHLAWLHHDSVVLDLVDSERDLVIPLIKIFADTVFGEFKINLKLGSNYGDMRKIDV